MTYAHDVLPRAKWARDKVYEVRSESHLDVGCKDGYFCMTLAEEGIDCVGVDPSEDAIHEAEMRSSQRDIEVEWYNAFGEDIDIDHYFDTVTCMEVLEHVVDPDKLITNLSTHGRYLLFTTPDKDGRFGLKDAERNPEHVRLYDQDELTELMSNYGEVIEVREEMGELYIMIDTDAD